MKITSTPFRDLLIIDYALHGDSRGFFMELYNKDHFDAAGLDIQFKQDNLSRSGRGILRGMHYQRPPFAQGKLVTVLQGEVFDAVVDLRRNESTFGQWFGITLNDKDRKALYVPPGFAHGFCVLSETADFFYKCTETYHPEAQQSLLWNDSAVGINWPIKPDINAMTDKDKNALSWSEITYF